MQRDGNLQGGSRGMDRDCWVRTERFVGKWRGEVGRHWVDTRRDRAGCQRGSARFSDGEEAQDGGGFRGGLAGEDDRRSE